MFLPVFSFLSRIEKSSISVILRVQFLRAPDLTAVFLVFLIMSNQTRKSSQRSSFQSKIAIGVLAGWLAGNFSAQAIAANITIGNGGIKFDRDTTLEQSFLESHGAYQSTFGVVNLDTKEKTPLLVEVKPSDASAPVGRPSTKLNDRDTRLDFAGTPGNAVPQPISKFTFRANNNYAFYLESTLNGRPAGIVYSTDTLNPNQERQVVFAGKPADLCSPGGMVLAWDDTGSKLVKTRQQQDQDFDDYIVKLRDSACAPKASEPPGVVASAPPGGVPPGVSGGGGGGELIGLGLAAIALLPPGSHNKDNSSRATNPPVTNQPITDPPGKNPPGTPPKDTLPPGKQIPTPSTFLGSTLALGLIAFKKRQRTKQLKKK